MFYPTTCVGLRYGPCPRLCLAVFLGSMFPPAVRSPRGARGTVASRPPGGFACRALSLPRFNVLFRQHAGFPLLRRRVARGPGAGILTGSPSGRALRLPLRPRLTLIRLALIRNPWSLGGRVSRPPYRYLYLHLLFHNLQHISRYIFDDDGMLPYQPNEGFHSFGSVFNARLLSTPNRSTSELLRTL